MSDYDYETFSSVRPYECADCHRRMRDRGTDGRCAKCVEPEPLVRTPELLRGWAKTVRDVAEMSKGSFSPVIFDGALAKADEWEREAKALEVSK